MRPTAARLLPILAFVLLGAAALAGCERVLGPREYSMMAGTVDGGSYTVRVLDSSGRLDNIEIEPGGLEAFGAVANVPGQPNVVIVPWTGGECDERTDIQVAAAGPGIVITIRATVTGQVCEAIGVGHWLRLTAPAALPAAAVTVTMLPSISR
jgi:hypothetical protein